MTGWPAAMPAAAVFATQPHRDRPPPQRARQEELESAAGGRQRQGNVNRKEKAQQKLRKVDWRRQKSSRKPRRILGHDGRWRTLPAPKDVVETVVEKFTREDRKVIEDPRLEMERSQMEAEDLRSLCVEQQQFVVVCTRAERKQQRKAEKIKEIDAELKKQGALLKNKINAVEDKKKILDAEFERFKNEEKERKAEVEKMKLRLQEEQRKENAKKKKQAKELQRQKQEEARVRKENAEFKSWRERKHLGDACRCKQRCEGAGSDTVWGSHWYACKVSYRKACEEEMRVKRVQQDLEWKLKDAELQVQVERQVRDEETQEREKAERQRNVMRERERNEAQVQEMKAQAEIKKLQEQVSARDTELKKCKIEVQELRHDRQDKNEEGEEETMTKLSAQEKATQKRRLWQVDRKKAEQVAWNKLPNPKPELAEWEWESRVKGEMQNMGYVYDQCGKLFLPEEEDKQEKREWMLKDQLKETKAEAKRLKAEVKQAQDEKTKAQIQVKQLQAEAANRKVEIENQVHSVVAALQQVPETSQLKELKEELAETQQHSAIWQQRAEDCSATNKWWERQMRDIGYWELRSVWGPAMDMQMTPSLKHRLWYEGKGKSQSKGSKGKGK